MNNKPKYNEIIFTQKQLNDIKESYLNGESSTKIGKKYNVCYQTILRTLNKMGITSNSSRSHRKYLLDEKYFDNIDTPNKAYILGFFFADGSNSKSKGTISMALQEEDKEILEKIRKELHSEKPLEFIDYSNKHDFGYNYKNQYRLLLLFSNYLCNSLEKQGMVPNKSLILNFPNISSELYSHFIRGYFDGDGSYCPNITKEGKFQPLITFTSTKSFCENLQKIIIDTLNIPGGNIYDASCHNGITKVLSISGNQQVKKILNWLYKDAELYLDRKYQKYINSYLNNSLSA